MCHQQLVITNIQKKLQRLSYIFQNQKYALYCLQSPFAHLFLLPFLGNLRINEDCADEPKLRSR